VSAEARPARGLRGPLASIASDPGASEPERELAAALGAVLMAQRRLHGRTSDALDDRPRRRGVLPAGITIAQFRLAFFLSSAPGGSVSTSELAEHACVSAASTSQMVGQLEAAGVVRRVRDPGDRRVVRVELTDEGRLAVDRLAALVRERWRRAVAGLDDDEMATAAKVLHRLAGIMEPGPA
jgi:DNA-binding MarR family transcriptional regulator